MKKQLFYTVLFLTIICTFASYFQTWFLVPTIFFGIVSGLSAGVGDEKEEVCSSCSKEKLAEKSLSELIQTKIDIQFLPKLASYTEHFESVVEKNDELEEKIDEMVSSIREDWVQIQAKQEENERNLLIKVDSLTDKVKELETKLALKTLTSR